MISIELGWILLESSKASSQNVCVFLYMRRSFDEMEAAWHPLLYLSESAPSSTSACSYTRIGSFRYFKMDDRRIGLIGQVQLLCPIIPIIRPCQWTLLPHR